MLHYGTYADYLVVPAATAGTAKPASVDFLCAAALPIPAMTALLCLDAAGVTAGVTVLIVGATGGVGSYAVQKAAHRQAHVIATARSAVAAYITALGAAETVDYTQGDIVEAVRLTHPGGIDALIDVVSNRADLEHISQLLRSDGHLATTVHAADPAG